MNIVKSGNQFMVYGEDVKTYKELPPMTYLINFDKMRGFYLTLHNDLRNNDTIYGNMVSKVKKTLNTYNALDRNMGVILSGPKGAGKSMFARELAKQGNVIGLPLIICDTHYIGLADFLSSVQQECIVLFDEFDKTFAKDSDGYDPQVELLSLFDGVDDGKKLFVITCNEVQKLNDYFLNRPGRFHYHFKITPPEADEMRAYMKDNLTQEAYDKYIDKLTVLGGTTSFTYDVLRAIAFELNQGYDLDECLSDLNIERDIVVAFMAEVEFSNGIVLDTTELTKVNFLTDSSLALYMNIRSLPKLYRKHIDYIRVCFPISSINISENYSVNPKNATCIVNDDWFDTEEDNDTEEIKAERKAYTNFKEWFDNIKSIKLKRADTFKNTGWQF